MRRGILLGGGALVGAAALVTVMWLRGGDAGRPAPAAALSTSASSASPASPSQAMFPVPSGMEARALGFHLLTLSNPEQVRAGLNVLTEAAEKGEVEAQIALGRVFLQGSPAIPKDAPRAHGWFMRAVPSRHPSAAYFLGVMSQSGQGVKADLAEAARWFETAAEAGSPDAMFMLANAYRAGAGVPKSDAKAIEFYEKAAEMEHPAALQALAMAYLYGEMGLEPDEAERRRYMLEAEHALKHQPVPP